MYHHFFHNSVNDTSATVVITDEALTGDQLTRSHGLPEGWGYWGVFDFDLEWALTEAAKYGFRGTVENLKIINA